MYYAVCQVVKELKLRSFVDNVKLQVKHEKLTYMTEAMAFQTVVGKPEFLGSTSSDT